MCKKCIMCGSKEFELKSERFCSQKCIRDYRTQKSKESFVICKICGKQMLKCKYKAHLNVHIKEREKQIRIYICENCGKEKIGVYGSGRFCSQKCARNFSTKAKRKEINKKVSKTLIQKLLNEEQIGFCKINNKNYKKYKKEKYICLECGELYIAKHKEQKFCSVKCSAKSRGWSTVHNKLSHEDWSIINKKAYESGKNYVAGGTSNWLQYKDIKVQGTYELRTCYILDKWKELGKIKDWEYTNDRIPYIGADAKQHTYLLDFKVFNHDGSFYYIETKGYEQENDKFKWNAVKNKGYKLKIWFKKEIIKEEKKIKY